MQALALTMSQASASAGPRSSPSASAWSLRRWYARDAVQRGAGPNSVLKVR